MVKCRDSFTTIHIYMILTAITFLSIMGVYNRSLSSSIMPFQVMPSYVDDDDTQMYPGTKKEGHIKLTHSGAGIAQKDNDTDDEKPLLTIFTTFKNVPDRFQIHSNVLMNWAQYMPKLQPVLFAFQTDKRLVSKAKDLGWLVLSVPRMNPNKIPFFKDMYFKARETVDSVFYGYSNGDLLFDNGLIDTLDVVSLYLDQLHQTMIIGKRYNFPIRNRVLYKPSVVAKTGKAEGKLFREDAEDYFLIAHNSFPWNKVPDIVIGRPAYDNFVVGLAIMNKVSVVDATETLLCLHQSGRDGDFAGHMNKDVKVNFKVIGNFKFEYGHTTSAQYKTQYKGSHIELWKRKTKTAMAYHLVVQIRTTLPPVVKSTTSPTTTTTKITSSSRNNNANSNITTNITNNNNNNINNITTNITKITTANTSTSTMSTTSTTNTNIILSIKANPTSLQGKLNTTKISGVSSTSHGKQGENTIKFHNA